MKTFKEYEIVYKARIAVTSDTQDLETEKIMEALTKRLETVGLNKFLIGHTTIIAYYQHDDS